MEEENQIQNHMVEENLDQSLTSEGGREPDTEPSYLMQEENRIQNNYI
jgi:hypothetical protein